MKPLRISLTRLALLVAFLDLASPASAQVVTNNANSGAGSLRDTIAGASSGATITFTNTLSGATITLASQITISKNLTIDASTLTNGITISGSNASRVLEITSGNTVVLDTLTIVNGSTPLSSGAGGPGAGILNAGNLTLRRATVSGNTTSSGLANIFGSTGLPGGDGGGIYSSGTLTLENCTVAGNHTGNGGNDTFDGDAGYGAGIYNSGTARVKNSTLSANITGFGSSSLGGGIYNSGTLLITNTIVANNTALSDANISGAFSGINNLTSGNPMLAALGNYGGPNQTMRPLHGSPAIDTGTNIAGLPATDQRGFARIANGRVDIGAVESGLPYMVNTVLDETDGVGINNVSLREAISAGEPNSIITFSNTLAGQTILLTNGQLLISGKNLTIDASALAGGIQINGNASSRIFQFNAGTTNVLVGLTVTNGYRSNENGGGIHNAGTLTLNSCTVSSNVLEGLNNGCGIYNSGTLTVNQSTLSGNYGVPGAFKNYSGVGIYNAGTLTVSQSTFSGNVATGSATNRGGGIYNSGAMTLRNVTVVSNNVGSATGGGIYNDGTVTLTNTIVAGNTASSSPEIFGSFSGSSNLTTGNPMLAPLGNYGGPTQTMPPLSGSPAIDAGNSSVTNIFATDQRGFGFPRLLGGSVDIGAVEADGSIPGYTYGTVVNTTDDFLNGSETNLVSLRNAIAFATNGSTITFVTNLSGAAILLTNGQLLISSKNLTIDASALAGGIQINGNASSRIFQFNAGTTNVLVGLTVTNGYSSNGNGGGIHNSGTLTLNSCTVSSNVLEGGGGFNVYWGAGIYNSGTLTVNQSTLSGNYGVPGGFNIYYGVGIYNSGTLTVSQSTFSGNVATGSATNRGGGIYNSGAMTLRNVTVVSNNVGSATGGGIYNDGTLTLTNTIVAGNTAGSFTNILGSFSGGSNLTSGNPMLAPLGNYGGPTQTMPPLSGSPAIDAGNSSVTNIFATDQRGFGFPRLLGGSVDIGAVEAQYAPIAVTQPATAPTLTTATLHATVTPNGALTTTWFEYGATTNYGLVTASNLLSAGVTNVAANLTGLTPATFYHFRAVATNDIGITHGNDLTFHTAGITNVVLNNLNSGAGSLRDVVAGALSGDIITFTNTLSGATILLTSGQITVSKNLTIDASALANGIQINGNASSRIFQFNASTTNVLTGLTLTNGSATGSFPNSAGGAIYINSGANLTLNNSTLTGNSGSYGGGMYSEGTLTLNNSTLSGNSANFGGGTYQGGGTLTLNNSTLSGNSATDGGGIYNTFGTLTINNSTLTGNSAGSGGGIYNEFGTLTINNSTLTGNSGGSGGGIYNNFGTLTLTNSIVAGNTAGLGTNIFGSFSGANNLTDGNPMLAPLGNYGGPTQTMPPLPGSPAIDACFNGFDPGLSYDQRGVGYPRLSGAYADIGAVEFQVVPGNTLAWWRFEAGPDGSNVSHGAGIGVFAADVPDSSGSGNHLSIWSTGGVSGYGYRSDRPVTGIPHSSGANRFSVQNTGVFPAMFTAGGAPIRTVTPLAWTIEAAFQPETNGFRTLVGRDSIGTDTLNSNHAALYLQITPANQLAIKYCDVSGYFHQAISASNMVPGFVFPTNAAGVWQAAAAVCDGSTLKLYYKNIEGGGVNYTLVAQTDLTLSGSPDTRLTDGAGFGSDWTNGSWSVGRGLFAGVHTDRAYGFIDEVRISSAALSPDEFLFSRQVVNLADSGPGSLRQVMADAVSGETITFATNLSGGTILLTSGQLTVAKNLTIDASALPGGIVINGNGSVTSNRVFDIASGGFTVVMNSLTITGGNAAGPAPNDDGGGIRNLFTNTLVLVNCTLHGNMAADGGGAITSTGGTLRLLNSTIASNSAPFGGAIFLNGASTIANLTNTTLSGNSAGSQAGGVLCQGATVNLVNTIVAGNTAPTGTNIHTSGGGVINTSANNLVNTNALLAPLGNYGGPTQTMPPLPGSPAIDAGVDSVTNSFATDQRGFARLAGAHVDIGAVEPEHAVVLNNNDSGIGSLRQTVADISPAGVITFTNTLSGQTILLTSGQITVDKNLTIDASMLPGGISIDGNATSRIFQFNGGTINMLIGLTITNGFTTGNGGGIRTDGTLTLNNCTLAGNSALGSGPTGGGGGIANSGGTLTVNQSTLSSNTAPRGGGIWNGGTLIVSQSTVSGNFANFSGGGIYFDAFFSPTLLLTNSIVAGNTPDNITGPFSGANNLTSGNPLLAPLGNYGGPTQTMPPLPGSPAIDGCTNGTSFVTDQRGFPRVAGAFADIGAVESGNAIPGYTYGTVVTTTNDFLNGLETNLVSLRNAVAFATNGATITFATNLSGGTILLTSGQLLVGTNLSIDASMLPGGIAIDGNGPGSHSRVMEIGSGLVVALDSLTFTNGAPIQANGGGLLINSNAMVTLRNSALLGNSAFGSGGGGIYVVENGVLTIQNTSIIGNIADGQNGGGGIYLESNTVVGITNSVLADNSTYGQGGGGIYNLGALTVNQSTLSGNYSFDLSGGGGGIYNNGALALNQSTLSDNSATNGGGIYNDASGTVTLTNTIVAGNFAGSDTNIYGTFSGASNLTSGNPLLAPLGNYGGPTQTMPPLTNSPAIDAGSDSATNLFATDQRGAGFPRLSGSHVDIGAVEYQYGITVIVATDPPVLTGLTMLGNGTFQFGFTNLAGASFNVFATTNAALPFNQWLNLGAPVESPPGVFQFTDLDATNHPTRFYRVVSPGE